MCKLIKAQTKELPIHKGNKRLWIATQKLNDTVFANKTYHYEINKSKKQLIIVSSESKDNRKITVRKSNNVPIIDINNIELSELFKGIDKVTVKIYDTQIIIEPLKELLEQKKANAKFKSKEITFVDIFAGSGTLSEAFKQTGMISIGAVELDDGYCTNYELNNTKTFTYNTSVAVMDLNLLPSATVLIGGVPCENYSQSGIVKQCSLNKPTKEAGLTGSLGYFFLQAVEKIRPAVVVIEEVPNFQKSAMADIVRAVLQLRGYSISEAVLKANEYGSMTKRKRYCLVATISKNKFVFPEKTLPNTLTVKDILEVPIQERVWLTKENSKSIAYSLEKEQKHIEKKQGFRIARASLEDTIVATITKGYYKNRLTDPILVHPDSSEMFSWFTPRELARINGLKESFILPVAKTKAGEIIGQGVAQEPFVEVARQVIKHIKENSK